MMPSDRNTRAIQTAMPNIPPGTIKKLRDETRVHVEVELPDETAPHYRERFLQAQIALNLLPRMFKRVTSSGVDRAKLFPKSPSHVAKIMDPSPDAPPSIIIALTDAPLAQLGRIIYADNRGWTAYRSTISPCVDARGPANPIGAIYAGLLAVGEAFNTIFQPHDPRIKLVEAEHRHDLITYKENQPPNFEPRIDNSPVWLDDVVIAGLGAVGQALTYALAAIPQLRGDIRLVDHEATDDTNLARYVLSFKENTNQLKTDIAREHLAQNANVLLRIETNVGQSFHMGHVTEITPLANAATRSWTRSERAYHPPADYVTVMEIRNSRPAKTVVACVDSAATRRDIQMGLPRLVLNGWTKTDQHGIAYGVGAHAIHGDWQCLACAYHRTERADIDDTEFTTRITSWPKGMVARYLRTGQPLERAQLDELCDRLGLDDQRKAQLIGRPLRDVIHMQCGLAGLPIQGRFETSPIFHIPALVGVHLATEIIARAFGTPTALQSQATFSWALPPNEDALFVAAKEKRCLCTDPDVQRVYAEEWGSKATGADVPSPEDALARPTESNAPLNPDSTVTSTSEGQGWQALTP